MFSDDSDDASEEVDVYRKKYRLIAERCQAIQQDNERLEERLIHVKAILKRRRKERKFLMDRLDMHGDNWRNVPLSLKLEDASDHGSGLKSGSKSKSSGSHGEKKKNTSKKKSHKADKNAPKRPANPYFQFCQEQRTSTIEEMTSAGQPEPSKVDVTKHLAYKWNLLPQDDKKIVELSVDGLDGTLFQAHFRQPILQVYYDKYKRSKERYNADMQIYTKEKNSNM